MVLSTIIHSNFFLCYCSCTNAKHFFRSVYATLFAEERATNKFFPCPCAQCFSSNEKTQHAPCDFREGTWGGVSATRGVKNRRAGGYFTAPGIARIGLQRDRAINVRHGRLYEAVNKGNGGVTAPRSSLVKKACVCPARNRIQPVKVLHRLPTAGSIETLISRRAARQRSIIQCRLLSRVFLFISRNTS